MKFIGAETQADLEVQFVSWNNSSAEFQHCVCDNGTYGIAAAAVTDTIYSLG